MPELLASDVELYTHGRLLASDVETTRVLNRALAVARAYCEWHVKPVKTGHVVTLDGSGNRLLMLPTMRLQTLNSVVEDGVALNIANLKPSTGVTGGGRGPVLLRKKTVGSTVHMRWSCEYGAVTVNMDHGYDVAPDWDSAVLELVDRMSSQVGAVSGSSGPIIEKTVDDVTTRWSSTIGAPQNAAMFSLINKTLLEPYRLVAPY